jgi:hypothetical protein
VHLKEILDFGVAQEMPNSYDDDVPEIMIYLDEADNICLAKGSKFGRKYITKIATIYKDPTK